MPNLIAIIGPTASGKTRLAAGLAAAREAEVLSADSRQVYRRMDLGTGKDLSDFVVKGKQVPCHLIDLVDPEQEFSVFEYQRHFYEAFSRIVSAGGGTPFLAGGTGLYLESVLLGYRMPRVPEDPGFRKGLAACDQAELADRLRRMRPSLHNRTDLCGRERLIRALEIAVHADRGEGAPVQEERPAIDAFTIGIRVERTRLREQITRRLKRRLESGMVEEVEGLHASGVSWERLDRFGLEYRFISRYLRGELGYEDMFRLLNTAIHQFAKRQETWFRRMERRGVAISWIEGPDAGRAEELLRQRGL
ncbi:MAG TPA: tRNA (adenosine(37)-N6)-dimethylallyltransferase MiaA [Syntrophales bacterium]|nr:tRNA (adenosine(37)-N6)-dimethylallyltransferase MiaA [Syntrophales bacterium]